MGDLWKSVFPPKPTFVEKDIPDLHGKVYLVTGGASGVGFELCKMLYEKNGTVYLAGRSQSNGDTAIAKIKELCPSAEGAIHFLQLDLGDLTTIKASADEFKSKERRLDVIVHNAGVMIPPPNSKTAQGWELQFGTNVLGPFVFQKHLQPLLLETAKIAPENSVRVCWASSLAMQISPKTGVDYDDLAELGNKKLSAIYYISNQTKYAQSKAANNILAAAYARKFSDTGVISLSFNPGNLKTNLTRHSPWWYWLIEKFLLYPARFGGLTELFCALSPTVDQSRNGAVIEPWGRFAKLRKDIEKSVEEGGAEKLWEWCDDKTKEY